MKLIDLGLNLNGKSWQLLHALNVMDIKDEQSEEKHECTTTAWYNGRERGFCLTVHYDVRQANGKTLYICFAEDRIGPEIVVYTWECPDQYEVPCVSDMPAFAWSQRKYYKEVDAATSRIRGTVEFFLRYGELPPTV